MGPLCLLFICGLWLWLYLHSPLLVNPFEIASRLENETLESSILPLMALMLPIIVLACFGLLIAIIVFMYAVFSNEKTYMEIISELSHSHKKNN
jgi:hypothetical protein